MDCREFKTSLEASDSLAVSAELKAHAGSCAACRKILEAHERMSLGLEVNRRAVSTPDLTPRIMQRIAQQKPEPSDSTTWVERLVALLTPTTPLKSSLFYVTAGVVIVALCHTVIDRGNKLQDLRQKHSWRMVSSEGRISGVAPGSKDSGIVFGTRIECEAGANARVEFGDRFRISLNEARAVLASGQIDLESGSVVADITHDPNALPFLIRTPHANIENNGARFTVTVLNGSSTVQLHSGRLKVTAAGNHQSREMSPSDKLTLSRGGFEHSRSPVLSDPATYTDSPDFRRVQPPEE